MWLRKEQGSVVAKAASRQPPSKVKVLSGAKQATNAKPVAKAAAAKPAPKAPSSKTANSKSVSAKPIAPTKTAASKAPAVKAPAQKPQPPVKAVAAAKAEPAKASKVPAKSNGNPIVSSKARNEQSVVISPGPKLGSVAGRNLPPAKAPRPVANNDGVIAAPVPTNDKPRKNQAGFLAKELEHFRDLLLAKRGEIVGDMSAMEREALRTSGGSNLSTLPIHMADMGTDNYEQEFTLSLVETDRKLLREINNALAKIQNGTYGICEGTGKPISKARLEVQPWARYSIEYAKQMERAGR